MLDRLILTATESVWRVHEKAIEGDTPLDAEDKKAIEDDREVTLALIRYKSPLAAVSFPRFVNTTTNMQAAAPAIEITRLLRMVGVGTDVLRGFGAGFAADSGFERVYRPVECRARAPRRLGHAAHAGRQPAKSGGFAGVRGAVVGDTCF